MGKKSGQLQVFFFGENYSGGKKNLEDLRIFSSKRNGFSVKRNGKRNINPHGKKSGQLQVFSLVKIIQV